MKVEVLWIHQDAARSTHTDFYEAEHISSELYRHPERETCGAQIQLFNGDEQTGVVQYAAVSRVRKGTAVPDRAPEEITEGDQQ